MHGFWQDFGGFLPPFGQEPLALLHLLRWNLVREMLFQPYVGGWQDHGALINSSYTVAAILLLVGLGAIESVWKRRTRPLPWLILLWGPFLLVVLTSRLEIYPLGPRTSVFLLPLVGLHFGAGVDLLLRAFPRRISWSLPAFVALALLPSGKVLWDRPPVYQVAPVRELLAELSEMRDPEEPVYGFWYSGAIFGYYGGRFGLEEGIGLAKSGDLRADLKEVSEYRGEKGLWVVFPHLYGEERDVILCFLEAVGRETQRLNLSVPGRSSSISIHRFDLSDSSRFDSVDPGRFPIDPSLYGAGCPAEPLIAPGQVGDRTVTAPR
jgi:hypothetical protein